MALAGAHIEVSDDAQRQRHPCVFTCSDKVQNAVSAWLGIAIESSPEFIQMPLQAIDGSKMGAGDEVIKICFSINDQLYLELRFHNSTAMICYINPPWWRLEFVGCFDLEEEDTFRWRTSYIHYFLFVTLLPEIVRTVVSLECVYCEVLPY